MIDSGLRQPHCVFEGNIIVLSNECVYIFVCSSVLFVSKSEHVCGGWRLVSGSLFTSFHLSFWALTKLEFINLSRLPGQQAPGFLLSLPPHCWDSRCASCYFLECWCPHHVLKLAWQTPYSQSPIIIHSPLTNNFCTVF